MADRTYLVDSDVFITAKNLVYSFDLCPGFWKSVLHHHRKGRVFSVDRVRSELLEGKKTEDLVRWVRDAVPGGFFLPEDTGAVARAYTDIMIWVSGIRGISTTRRARTAGSSPARGFGTPPL